MVFFFIIFTVLIVFIFQFSRLGVIVQVMITRGKDKGETGVIKRVIRSQNRVIVDGKNLVRNSYFFEYIVQFI